MTVQNSIPDVVPGDWVTFTKGKSKSLIKGMPYKVTEDYKVKNVKGRGLEFKRAEKPENVPDSVLKYSGCSRLEKFLKQLVPEEFHKQIRSKLPNLDSQDFMLVYVSTENKRVRMKMGRAFRLIFPQFGDPAIEYLVDKCKDTFGPEVLTILESSDPEEISSIMRGGLTSKRSGISCANGHKNLMNSCMRYRFPSLPLHPYSVYGSEDFKVVFAMNQNNKMSGRVVVLKNHPYYFPVYSANTDAQKILSKFITENSLRYLRSISDSITAKLNMSTNSSRIVNPYYDIGRSYMKKDQKEFFWSNKSPDFSCRHVSGGVSGWSYL